MAETAGIISKFSTKQSEQSDAELLKLYWNRATVKRELTSLRRERHELLDKLKEQEGAIIRAKEELDSLERLLTNPLAAANAMVYFQLRHLWRVGALRVQQFSKELHAQRERRERDKLHGAAIEKRKLRINILNEKLQGLALKERNVAHEVEALRQQLERMNGVTRLFRRPGIKRRMSGMNKGREALRARIEEIQETQASIKAEPLPDISGLSLDSRRLINLASLALAQELVLHFSEHNLSAFAKAATERPVSDMKFGDRRDCDRLVDRIRARIGDLKDQKRTADAVKVRTDYLLKQVRYSDETSAVPLGECFENISPQVPATSDERAQKRASDMPLKVNVLTDDFWDVLTVLI